MEKKKLNIYIVGNKYVGKSSFAQRYLKDTFKKNYLSTIGVNCLIKYIKVGNQNCSVRLYDFSGSDRYSDIYIYLKKKIDAIIFMYDVTNESSLNSMEKKWINVVSEVVKYDCPKFLIGTKIDLKRSVNEEEGKKLADKYKMDYFEVSSKSGEEVNETMESIIKKLLNPNKKVHTFFNDTEKLDDLYKKVEKKSFWKSLFNMCKC